MKFSFLITIVLFDPSTIKASLDIVLQ